MEDDSDLPSDPEVLQGVIEECEARITSVKSNISLEQLKMQKYKVSEEERAWQQQEQSACALAGREHTQTAQLLTTHNGTAQGSCQEWATCLFM